jgi:hypothetical protein
MTTPADFPVLVPGEPIQGISHQGAVCDLAIALDRADWLQECIDWGWIDRDSETLVFTKIRALCIRRGKIRCAELLSELDWPMR